nr:WD repeat containing protein 68 [Hymenolepis microstoma]
MSGTPGSGSVGSLNPQSAAAAIPPVSNPKNKEIYKYEAPWNIFSLNWSLRQDKRFRLAIGSFIEEYNNRIQIITLDEEQGEFVAQQTFNHYYPATKVMWMPDMKTNAPDLLATSGDYLRIWKVSESPTKLECTLNNNQSTGFCAPLTSFDWNESDPSIIGASSVDTTCTIWGLETQQVIGRTRGVSGHVKTQVIAHDKEVYDIAFSRAAGNRDVFASVGADGSVRLFDLRNLLTSTIIYENRNRTPLLRLAWNKQDPNYIATFALDSKEVTILDLRVLSTPMATLDNHRGYLNGLAWAPHSSCHICTAGEDCMALIWDIQSMPRAIEDPILAYTAAAEINQIQWSALQPDWISICISFTGIKLQKHLELCEDDTVRDFIKLTNSFTIDAFKQRDKSRLSEGISTFTSNYTAPCMVAALSGLSGAMSKFCQSGNYAKYKMPDEALYGRVGYLSGLMLLLDNGHEVDDQLVSKVVKHILESGRKLSEKLDHREYENLMRRMSNPPVKPPLMFIWHDKFYLGAAHGYAGILQILLKVNEKLPQCLPEGALETDILPTVKWLAKLQLRSGNWPSSLGSSLDNDHLVQWCHGATGVVPLMLAAYKVTGDRDYLQRAERGGEVIWERGLLTKGCGLCHGSAGSGYALLSLYKHTGDMKYLQRAAAVALWCADYFNHAERTPDRPLSLFEGLSGTIMFLSDMMHPGEADFPLIN